MKTDAVKLRGRIDHFQTGIGRVMDTIIPVLGRPGL